MTVAFTPDFLARAAEQLGWDESPSGQQKRLEDRALLQELMQTTADHLNKSCHAQLPPLDATSSGDNH